MASTNWCAVGGTTVASSITTGSEVTGGGLVGVTIDGTQSDHYSNAYAVSAEYDGTTGAFELDFTVTVTLASTEDLTAVGLHYWILGAPAHDVSAIDNTIEVYDGSDWSEVVSIPLTANASKFLYQSAQASSTQMRISVDMTGDSGPPVFYISEIYGMVDTVYSDIGLRIYDGTTPVSLACREATTDDALRLQGSDGVVYGIPLVATTHSLASALRIQTNATTTMSVRKMA